ncbi:uncharacterized protein PSFLO_06095 [Pseudozyma flocculosa]|uniref:Uncharacterized protein n=1 Tax=Pseudozyma flocculosa TaxID=84751 RepID=A0A5C3F833_9BASI|nr:uncharacterized protein PSFLO_06095 [Pseudozyma flocculosa]
MNLAARFSSCTATIVLNHVHSAVNMSKQCYLSTTCKLPILTSSYSKSSHANSLIPKSNARFWHYAGLVVSALVRMAAKRARDDATKTGGRNKRWENPKMAEVDRQADNHVQHLVDNMKEIVDQLNQLVLVKCTMCGCKRIKPAVSHAQDLHWQGKDQLASQIEGLVIKFQSLKTKKEKQRREERCWLQDIYKKTKHQDIWLWETQA